MAYAPGSKLFLLLPEWQGHGVSNVTAVSARGLARQLLSRQDVAVVEAPDDEELHTEENVLGLDSIAARAARAHAMIRARNPDRIVMVGATCGVEVAPIAYLNQKYAGELAILWLDAHADLNTPASSPSGHFHGMVLRTLLGDGPAPLVRGITRPLTPNQVWLVGTRDFDPPEADYVNRMGIRTAGLDEIRDPVEFVRNLKREGFSRVYLHLDLDVVNPDDFSSSLMRTPGGPSLDDVVALACQVNEQCDVVGLSVVEFCERADGDRDRLCDALSGLPQFA